MSAIYAYEAIITCLSNYLYVTKLRFNVEPATSSSVVLWHLIRKVLFLSRFICQEKLSLSPFPLGEKMNTFIPLVVCAKTRVEKVKFFHRRLEKRNMIVLISLQKDCFGGFTKLQQHVLLNEKVKNKILFSDLISCGAERETFLWLTVSFSDFLWGKIAFKAAIGGFTNAKGSWQAPPQPCGLSGGAKAFFKILNIQKWFFDLKCAKWCSYLRSGGKRVTAKTLKQELEKVICIFLDYVAWLQSLMSLRFSAGTILKLCCQNASATVMQWKLLETYVIGTN